MPQMTADLMLNSSFLQMTTDSSSAIICERWVNVKSAIICVIKRRRLK